jgi:Sulfotransferase family
MALPTFFVIGAAKAGSTSLHHYLDQHPEIQMTPKKDPRFFAGPENGIPYPPERISRLDEYEALFDPGVAVRGDASNDYAMYPLREGVPERIKELVPGARFLYLVRDPIARTVSHYQMRVAFEGEKSSLQDAVNDLSHPYRPCYIYPSLYGTQLERYLRHFAEKNMLVIDQAELLADRQAMLRRIFRFLSVDDTFESKQFDDELNKNRHRSYPPGYERFIEQSVAPLAQWLPQSVRSLRWSVERLLFPRLETPTLDADLRCQLETLFAGDIERLRGLTGKAFPSWSI